MILDRTVMWLTWRQLFARRRWLLAILFSLIPFAITALFKVSAADAEGSARGFFTGLTKDIILGTFLPLVAVVFGTTAFGGEIDDGTLVYLLVKPLPRWRVLLSKYVVAVLSTVAVMIPALALPWLLVRSPEIGTEFPRAFTAAALAGSALYCAIFLIMGLTTRRALVIGLIYVIAVETALSRSLDGVKSLSVREYMNTIASNVGGETVGIEPFVTTGTVTTMSIVIVLAAIAFGMRRLRQYELAERM